MKVFFVYSSHYAYILREENCKMLINYPMARDMNKFHPEIPRGFSEVLIDSGGFQMQTGVAEVYRGGYSLWLQLMLPNHPEVVGYFNLDILGNPLETLENQFYFESEGLTPIPTFHDGEDLSYLDFYCSNYEWVSIGGIVGKVGFGKSYFTKLITFLTNRYPGTKFHLLGIGIVGVNAYKQIRPYSCDFSTWSTVSRFGHAIIRDKRQLIKEVVMSDSDRQRLRTDKVFQEKMTREAVRNIKYFEETLSNLRDTDYQGLLV